MPDEFSLAIIGHTGWDKDILAIIPYSLAVSFEILNAEIDVYNSLRIINEIEIEEELNSVL